MADLPRWIRTDRVDSQAMFSAYIATVKETDPWFGKLTMRIHACDGEIRPLSSVTMISCVRMDCNRCRNRWGGYVFRWYRKSWYDKYLKMARRADVWMLGDPENDEPKYANIIGD